MSLRFRRVGRADLGVLAALQLDPEQVRCFLGPLADIEAAIRRGPAHLTVAIETAETCAGFYVIHPDIRDRSCWWLGWLALDVRQQGRGHGALAVAHALGAFRLISFCRRVRLLVASENLRARRLYERAGFRPVGNFPATGEIILERAIPGTADAEGQGAFALADVAAGARRVFRHRRLRFRAGPHAAWVIGVERGPPSLAGVALAEH